MHLDDSPELVASTSKWKSPPHVSLVVPDVNKAEARMKQYGVKLVKGVGKDVDPEGLAAVTFGLDSSLSEARGHGSTRVMGGLPE